MEKTAQKRSLLNKLRENTDFGGMSAEKVPFLNPGFQAVMDKLRESDDQARSIALGTSVGDTGIEPEDKASLKDLLKEAESALNRREYMKSAAFLSRFHNKIIDIVKSFQTFELDLSAIHEKFLLEDMDDDVKQQVLKHRKRLASSNNKIIKIAGIGDFLHNIFDERGRSLAAWEKRYPEKAKSLKISTSNILKLSKSVFEKLLKYFDEMAKARSKRMVEAYEKYTNDFRKLSNSYDVSFRKYYNDNVKDWADKLAKQNEAIENQIDVPESVKNELELSTPTLDSKDPSPSSESPISSTHDQSPSEPAFSGQAPSAIENSGPQTFKTPTQVYDVPKPTYYAPGGTSTQTPGPVPKASPVPKDLAALVPSQGPVTVPNKPSMPPSSEGIDSAPPFVGMFGGPPTPTLFTGLKPASKKELIASIERLSNESPIIVKKYLTKYAMMLNKSDPQSAKVLLDIANRIEV